MKVSRSSKEELSKIIDEREGELTRIEAKEREVTSLRSEVNELESELSSVEASKEAQKQAKQDLKSDLGQRITQLEQQVDEL